MAMFKLVRFRSVNIISKIMPNIIAFYSKNHVKEAPWSLKNIWDFTDIEKERIHNYIQWMFPTDDPRNQQTGKPYVDQQEIAKFNEDSIEGKMLRKHLLISYIKMMKFYGFDLKLENELP